MLAIHLMPNLNPRLGTLLTLCLCDLGDPAGLKGHLYVLCDVCVHAVFTFGPADLNFCLHSPSL